MTMSMSTGSSSSSSTWLDELLSWSTEFLIMNNNNNNSSSSSDDNHDNNHDYHLKTPLIDDMWNSQTNDFTRSFEYIVFGSCLFVSLLFSGLSFYCLQQSQQNNNNNNNNNSNRRTMSTNSTSGGNSSSSSNYYKYSNLDKLRVLMTFIMGCLPLVMCIIGSQGATSAEIPKHNMWYYYGCLAGSSLLVIIFQHTDIVQHRQESHVIHLWYLALVIVNFIQLRTNLSIVRQADYKNDYENDIFFVSFSLVMMNFFFIVFFKANRHLRLKDGSKLYRVLEDRETEQENDLVEPLLSDNNNIDNNIENAYNSSSSKKQDLPEVGVGLFANITFSWLNEILALGYQRALTHDDLYRLHPNETADQLIHKFEREWWKEVKNVPQMYGGLGKGLVTSSSSSLSVSSQTNANNGQASAGSGEQISDKYNVSLIRALKRGFGKTFYVSLAFKLSYDTLLFVGPLMLSRITNYLTEAQQPGSDKTYSEGVLLVALLFMSNIVQSIFLHQYFHRAFRTGMRFKSVITTAVFRKAMKIRPGQTKVMKADGTMEAKTIGEIVNLMSVDAQRLQDLMQYFAIVISAPFQITVCLYLLWNELQASVFAGVAVMILTVPISGTVAKKSRSIQKELMKVKDERIKVINEVFNGIKIIKFYAWERSFLDKVKQVRDMEMRFLLRYCLVNVLSRFTWSVVPITVSLASFSCYVATGHQLTAAKAFTSIALFNVLRFPLAFLPIMIVNIVEAKLSVERLQNFLLAPEIEKIDYIPAVHSSSYKDKEKDKSSIRKTRSRDKNLNKKQILNYAPSIEVKDANLDWDENAVLLKNLNFEAYPGQFTVIVGMTGSGKSGLLSALIGDIHPTTGSIIVKGDIAYTAQSAWIQNGTLKDNILFGKRFDPELYQNVLYACSLLPDLAILPAGDQTEIGEKGINLSGGQKQRIALARAVYQDSDVYLLDDCMSAVDSQVAAHILENCINGILSEKTVVLVTHNLHTIPSADQIILLDDKKISSVGSYEDFMTGGHSFTKMLLASEEAQKEKDDDDQPLDGSARIDRMNTNESTKSDKDKIVVGGKKPAQPQQQEAAGTTLIEKEGVSVGSVTWAVYIAYAKAAGGFLIFGVSIIGLILSQSLQISSNSWVSYWSDNNISSGTGIAYYALLVFSSAICTLIALIGTAYGNVSAASFFHNALMERLLRAPMSFFDTTPIGRILNRFSKDIYSIDEVLMNSMYMYLSTLITVLGTVAVITFVTPWFIIAALPPFSLYYFTQIYYVPTSRELKRLDSVSRSPIFSHFSESLDGVSTIRAFKAQQRFLRDNEMKIDYNLEAYYIYIASNRWLAVRLEFVGTCIVLLASTFAVLGKGSISPGLGGLSISYALSITQTLNWMVRMTSERESNIVAVERVIEYSEVEQEAPAIIEYNRPAREWPQNGRITLNNLSLRYREGLPLVLRNLSTVIEPGEKVGIVGRTGAGKSSMLLALLRLVESCEGAIDVDGIKINDIGLEDLRSKFSIIPQDPVLFTGSIRFNLDPFGEYDDHALYEALRRSHLIDHVNSLPDGIFSDVEEGGKNFSQGQRQLLCLSRALLRHSKILLLDEATSSVDHDTDMLIQQTIRIEFASSTVMTIAHRVDTILDYDKIIVMRDGKIRECGSPQQLINMKGEFFAIHEAHRKGNANF